MGDPKVVVEVIGKTDKLDSSISSATGKVSGFGNVVKGIGLGIGAAGFGLATAAVEGFVGMLGDAKTAYQEDAASQAKLKVALENNIPGWNGNTAAIEERIAAQMRLGFSDDEQRDSLAMLTGVLGDVDDAQAAMTAAMDLARLKNIDLATATDIVTKASQGKMKGLASVGIELGKNASLTEILGAITETAGGQAEAYANGPLGKQEAAQLKVGEAMEKIGGAVSQVSAVALPILAEAFTVLIDVMMEVWNAVQPVVSALVGALGPAFKSVAAFVSGTIIPIVRQVASVYFPMVSNAIKIVASVFGVAIGIITTYWRTVFTVVSNVVGALITVFKSISTAINTVATTVGSAVGKVVGFFTSLPGKISRAASGMFDGIWQAFRGVLNTIVRGWNSIKFSLPSIDLGPLGTFGGFTLGTPNLPYFHTGGIVPGAPGVDVPIMAQAGERIVPRDSAGNRPTLVINIESFIGSDRDIDRFADRVALRLHTA